MQFQDPSWHTPTDTAASGEAAEENQIILEGILEYARRRQICGRCLPRVRTNRHLKRGGFDAKNGRLSWYGFSAQESGTSMNLPLVHEGIISTMS